VHAHLVGWQPSRWRELKDFSELVRRIEQEGKNKVYIEVYQEGDGMTVQEIRDRAKEVEAQRG
jgi:hypothetical protein